MCCKDVLFCFVLLWIILFERKFFFVLTVGTVFLPAFLFLQTKLHFLAVIQTHHSSSSPNGSDRSDEMWNSCCMSGLRTSCSLLACSGHITGENIQQCVTEVRDIGFCDAPLVPVTMPAQDSIDGWWQRNLTLCIQLCWRINSCQKHNFIKIIS